MLQELIRTIVLTWSFQSGNYPGWEKFSDNERDRFVLRHIALHLGKASGKFAEAVEKLDHGQLLDRQLLVQALRNIFICLVRAGEHIDFTPDDLVAEVQKWAKEHQQS